MLAWHILSPDMFRSEAADTRMGSGRERNSNLECDCAYRWHQAANC